MRFVLYTHSLVSDWNHGNAHFLRGVLRELEARGHETLVAEPEDGWSRQNLVAGHGAEPIARFASRLSRSCGQSYGSGFDHAAAVDGADVVIVHEWNDPALIAATGRTSAQRRPLHPAVPRHPSPRDLGRGHHRRLRAAGLRRRPGVRRGAARALSAARLGPPGVHLARGGRHARCSTRASLRRSASDLVWIGNWGDGERAQELHEFLIEPARQLGLDRHRARRALSRRRRWRRWRPPRSRYGGWIANAEVPARLRRSPRDSARAAPALCHGAAGHSRRSACSRRWPAAFRWSARPGRTRRGCSGRTGLPACARRRARCAGISTALLQDEALAQELAASGLETIRSRHTCAHRVDELLSILVRARAARTSMREAAE